MTRCRPGDLAVVIRAANRSNVGRFVRVIGPHDGLGDLAMKHRTDVTVWEIESLGGPVRWSWPDGRRARRKRGPVPDDQLQPVRGRPQPGLRDARGARRRTTSKEPIR